jgi:hypothetical protein
MISNLIIYAKQWSLSLFNYNLCVYSSGKPTKYSIGHDKYTILHYTLFSGAKFIKLFKILSTFNPLFDNNFKSKSEDLGKSS